MGFFIHIGGKKNDVARNDITHLWARKWFFFIYVEKRMILQEIILHTCKLTSGSFLCTSVKKKNDIAHLWVCKWLFIHMSEEKNDKYCKK